MYLLNAIRCSFQVMLHGSNLVILYVQTMTSQVPELLQGPWDATHRCQLWLDPEAHLSPPTHFRLRTVRARWSAHQFFVEHLRSYGLLAYSKLTSANERLMLDPSLLTALVDRWRPETHTFHLRCGELAPTLKDVALITALPIRGQPLVPPPYSMTWREDVELRLGIPMRQTLRSGKIRDVPLGWLVDNFRDIPPNATDGTMRKHLFAYILYLLGMMFPNSHGDVVLPSMIKIAEEMVDNDLPPNPTYSFGSAVLAHTYRGLCDATKKNKKTKNRLLYLL